MEMVKMDFFAVTRCSWQPYLSCSAIKITEIDVSHKLGDPIFVVLASVTCHALAHFHVRKVSVLAAKM